MDFKKREELIEKNVLINSLDNTLTEVTLSFVGLGNFEIVQFYSDSFYDEFGIQAFKQDFKSYKNFFKRIKKKYIPFEFVFAINSVKTRLNFLLEKLNEYEDKQGYYQEYNFDYQIVITFIDRYLSLFKHYNSELLYQYCFDLQKGLFYINHRYTEQRLEIIEKTLKTIYFNEKYTGKEVDYDLGSSYFGTLYLLKQQDAKHFLEKEFEKDEYKTQTKNILEKKEETLIDYSNSKLTEKIIALNELGFLDFLKEKEPFNMSTFKLAEYLSLCLGEKATSIYPCINPIFNKTVKQRNNPYETIDTVRKTKKNLIQIGVKIE